MTQLTVRMTRVQVNDITQEAAVAKMANHNGVSGDFIK